jgi:HSP20 family protein
MCGHSRTVGARHVHYREVHAVFQELIHKPWGTACWCPAADVWEQEDAFVIEVDLPGVAVEDVCVLVENKTLIVQGGRTLAHAEGESVAQLCERPAGRFARTLHFEYILAADRIEHQLAAGVLTVTVPKPQDKQERQSQ